MNSDERRKQRKIAKKLGPHHTCYRKKKYRSERMAQLAAERVSMKSGRKIMTYPCSFCSQWHIGGNKWETQS